MSNWFDPHKSFLKLKIVWLFIFFLVTISALISYIIIKNTSLVIDPSANGFNYFVVVFKVPLGILALIIPIVALLAANHRSEQTKEQIRVTGVQNNFANFYKHMEEFDKYNESLERDKYNFFEKGRLLHNIIYPNARDGDYAISYKLTQLLIDANAHMQYFSTDRWSLEKELDKNEASNLFGPLRDLMYHISNEEYKIYLDDVLLRGFSQVFSDSSKESQVKSAYSYISMYLFYISMINRRLSVLFRFSSEYPPIKTLLYCEFKQSAVVDSDLKTSFMRSNLEVDESNFIQSCELLKNHLAFIEKHFKSRTKKLEYLFVYYM